MATTQGAAGVHSNGAVVQHAVQLDAAGGGAHTVYINGQPHQVVLAPQQTSAAGLTQQVLGWAHLSHAQTGGPIIIQAPQHMGDAATLGTAHHVFVNHAAPSYDPPSSESAHHGSLAAQIQAQQQVAAASAGTMVGLKRQHPLGGDAGPLSPNAGSSSAATAMTAERVGSSAQLTASQGGGASAGGGTSRHQQAAPATAAAPAKEAGPAPTATGVSSRYHGVTWYKASKRWQARLCTGRRQFHLGYFRTEEEAARAYDRAMIQVQGPKATQLNFPDEAASVAAGIAAGTAPAVPAALTQCTSGNAAAAAAGPGSADAPRVTSLSLKSGPGSAAGLHASGSFSRRATQAATTPPGSEPSSADTAAQLTAPTAIAGMTAAAHAASGTLTGQRSSSGGAEGDSNQAAALTPQQHQAMLMAQHQQWQFNYQQQVAAAQARAALANPHAAAMASRPQRLGLQLQQLHNMPLDAADDAPPTAHAYPREPSSTTRLPSAGALLHHAPGSFTDPLGRPLAMQLAAMHHHQSPTSAPQPASRNSSAPVLGLTLAGHHQHHQHPLTVAPLLGGLSTTAAAAVEPGSEGVVQVFAAPPVAARQHSNVSAAAALPSPTGQLDALAAVAAGRYQAVASAGAGAGAATMMEGVQHIAAPAVATVSGNGAAAGAAPAPEGGFVQLVGRPAVAGILMADTGEFLPTGTTGALQLYEHEWDGSRLVLRNVLVGLVATPQQQQQQQQQLQASLPLSEDTHMALAGGGGGRGATPPVVVLPAPPSSAPDLRGVPVAQALAPPVTGSLVVAATGSAMDVDGQ